MRLRALSTLVITTMLLCGACGRTQSSAAPPAATAAPQPPTPTPSPTQPALLAFVQHGDLWVAELTGNAPRRLSTDGAVSAPRWSPSGAWLAFCQHERLRVVRRAGGDAQALGPCSGRWLPQRDELAFADQNSTTIVDVESGRRRAVPRAADVWRPDGNAFASVELALTGEMNSANAPERTTSLWRTQADGSAATQLFDPGTPAPGGIIPAGWHGDTILFWTDPQFSASLLADGVPLHALPAAGGPPREVVPFMLTHRDFLSAAPDGTRIAVVEGGDRQTWTNKRLVTIDLHTGTRAQLTDDATAAFSPDWSPSGRQITFVAGPDVGPVGGGAAARAGVAQRRIWLIEQGGASARQLTDDTNYHDERPRWLADGSRVVFVRVDAQNQPSLWSVRADGSDLAQITPALGADTRDEEAWFGYYGYHDWDQLFDVWQPALEQVFYR